MKRLASLALLFFFLAYRPLFPVKKDTKLILDELQKLSVTVAGLERKITIVSADISELNKKVEIMADKVNAVSTNQADLTQSKESMLVLLQNIKEGLNAAQDQPDKNQRPDHGSLPATGRERRQRPGKRPPDKASPLSTRIPQASITPPIPTTSRKITIWPSRDSGNTSNSFPKAGWPTIPCTGSVNVTTRKKKYPDAISTFNELIAKYRDGDKVSAAMLKKGYALVETGKQSEGTMTLKDLISRFPLSEEASLAQQKLKEIAE